MPGMLADNLYSKFQPDTEKTVYKPLEKKRKKILLQDRIHLKLTPWVLASRTSGDTRNGYQTPARDFKGTE